MFANRIVSASAIVVLFAAGLASADFKPGNIFVTEAAPFLCTQGDPFRMDRIWEIDPETGEATLFAELADELCSHIAGLVFTPDGKGLRASSLINDQILEFASDGTFKVVLDATDGIGSPLGSNGVAYDESGNFYVVNTSPRNIMRFPVGGGPGVVIADVTDGIGGRGHIAIASDGDLYFMNNLSFGRYALRVPREGPIVIFDQYRNSITGVAADDEGHIFVGLNTIQTLLRYDAGDPDSIQELATGAPLFGAFRMTMSEDSSRLYVVPANKLYAVDPTDGSVTLISELTETVVCCSGIAVVPNLRAIPTMSEWGVVIMMVLLIATGAVVLRRCGPVASIVGFQERERQGSCQTEPRP